MWVVIVFNATLASRRVGSDVLTFLQCLVDIDDGLLTVGEQH